MSAGRVASYEWDESSQNAPGRRPEYAHSEGIAEGVARAAAPADFRAKISRLIGDVLGPAGPRWFEPLTSVRLKLTSESRRDGSLTRRFWRGPADPLIIAQARRAVMEFAAAHVPVGRLEDIVLCVSEAMTNAVTHGLDGAGTVTLAVALEQDALTVVVTDDGHGFGVDSPHAGLGLGLPLIAAIADRSEVSQAGG